MLLITDGEDQQGDAQQAAARWARRASASTPSGGERDGRAHSPLDKDGNVTGYKKDRENRTVLTRTDVAGLRELASRANGLVLRGPAGEPGVLQLLREIRQAAEGRRGVAPLRVQYDDKHLWFAWPAFALLCIAAALGDGPLWRRRMAT